MKSRVTQMLDSRGFVLTVHCGMWLLLYLAVAGLRGRFPDYRESAPSAAGAQPLVPAAGLAGLFSAGANVPPPDTNARSAFFTEHFLPKQAPPPPPPTTRKIELTYAGFYETGPGGRQVMVRLGDSFVVASVGARVTANLFAAEASIQTLVLTNPAAQTNVLPLNLKKELVVPIQ